MYGKPVEGVVTTIEKTTNALFTSSIPTMTVVDCCTVVWTHPKDQTLYRDKKNKVLARWSVGQTVAVYVDPDDPHFYDIEW